MIKEKMTHEMHELSQPELIDVSGGGEADDLAYDLSYALVTLSPAFWMLKYSKFIYDKVAN